MDPKQLEDLLKPVFDRFDQVATTCVSKISSAIGAAANQLASSIAPIAAATNSVANEATRIASALLAIQTTLDVTRSAIGTLAATFRTLPPQAPDPAIRATNPPVR